MAGATTGTKVREAVAVFDDVSSLEAAVEDLRAAGFADAEPFFAAFTWRGWIGHA